MQIRLGQNFTYFYVHNFSEYRQGGRKKKILEKTKHLGGEKQQENFGIFKKSDFILFF
jgi:hypothetical protein